MKRRLTTLDLRNIKTTPVPTGKATTWASFLADEAMEQARRNQARISDPAQRGAAFRYWCRSLEEIAKETDKNAPGLFDDIGLPHVTDAEAAAIAANPEAMQKLQNTFTQFLESLMRRSGIVLTQRGRVLFATYAMVQAQNNRRLDEYSLQAIWDRLVDLRVMDDVDYTVDPSLIEQPETAQPPQQPQPQPEAEADHNTTWSAEVADIFKRWLDYVATTYGIYLTERQCDLVRAWWSRNQHKNPWRGQDWTDLRKWLVRIGELDPAKALTPDERESLALENSDLTRMSFADRQAMKARLQALSTGA